MKTGNQTEGWAARSGTGRYHYWAGAVNGIVTAICSHSLSAFADRLRWQGDTGWGIRCEKCERKARNANPQG